MELSPRLYHWFVRPKWISNLYISNLIKDNFDITNKKILDFGCGIGSNCSIFKPKNYLGLDPDNKRIEYAKQIYPNYQFQVLKKEELKIPDNSFDYILIIAVLHHIPSKELRTILQDFHRILKTHGKIIVIEPCVFPESYFNNYFMNFFDNGNYIRSTEEYFELFYNQNYQINPMKKFRKLFFYNELFFSASLD